MQSIKKSSQRLPTMAKLRRQANKRGVASYELIHRIIYNIYINIYKKKKS